MIFSQQIQEFYKGYEYLFDHVTSGLFHSCQSVHLNTEEIQFGGVLICIFMQCLYCGMSDSHGTPCT